MADSQKELNNLKSDLTRIRTDLEDLKESSKSDLADLRERLQAQAQELFDRARHGVDEARERGKHAYEAVEHQIEERPLVSMVTAFGVGFLIGTLLGRK